VLYVLQAVKRNRPVGLCLIEASPAHLVDVALKAVETSARALDVLVAEAVPFGNDPCLPATTIFLADRPRPCDVRLMAT
jgi:hypothetical protein